MKTEKLKSNQVGAALVEFAIVLPLLLTLVFGIIEFGFLYYNKAMLTNASREGARLGILYDYPNRVPVSDIEAQVNSYCSGHLITFGETKTPTLDPPPTPCSDAGDQLTVTVNFEYEFLVLPNFVSGLTGPLNLQAVTTMRCE
jgi:Flp pilus assembly protein TadG